MGVGVLVGVAVLVGIGVSVGVGVCVGVKVLVGIGVFVGAKVFVGSIGDGSGVGCPQDRHRPNTRTVSSMSLMSLSIVSPLFTISQDRRLASVFRRSEYPQAIKLAL